MDVCSEYNMICNAIRLFRDLSSGCPRVYTASSRVNDAITLMMIMKQP